MNTFTVSGDRIAQCPYQIAYPLHFITSGDQPCRCFEYEQLLKDAKGVHHINIDLLGLRPRATSALLHSKIHTTRDLVETPIDDLSRVHGLTSVGLTAAIYLAAKRGVAHPDVAGASADDSGLRFMLQSTWEKITQGAT